ncbi:MAG: hypothetical protein WCF91_03520, partial [bacterium]
IIAIFLAVVILVVLSKEPKAVSGPIKTRDSVSKANTGSNSNDLANSEKNNSTSAATPSGELTNPYGTLISNHRPGQNGSDLNVMSQCITSPGARCYIKITKGDIIKTLSEKTADNTGSVTWEWNINEAGITAGNWQITAIATQGNQTKTTSDQIPLEVQ